MLWADTVSKNPTSHRARNNLGRVLTERGEYEQAARQFGAAIEIKPNYAEPHNNLGILHARAGRFDEAQAHFTAAIGLNPRYAQAYNNSGDCHGKPTSERRLRVAALFAAVIFIAHPVQIQTVTYIVQRMTSMATMFYLMSLLFYLLID